MKNSKWLNVNKNKNGYVVLIGIICIIIVILHTFFPFKADLRFNFDL